ncbi:hypothetical protein GF366_04120 [Candidatus Peregrinibacteria bacterium]|nr:hypothetical protein [Candidatus Peregrinibacteria bacterium]
MAEEIITSKTLEGAKEELRGIYKAKSNQFKEITQKAYESYDTDERPDSDNHLNEEKFEKGIMDILDLAYYKFLPERKVAYHIILKNKKGEKMEDYFLIIPERA